MAVLRSSGLLAHTTSTIPGVAAIPTSARAIRNLQRFKQRRGPFLLLTDSIRAAAKLARYFTPALRQAMRESWPGRTTLIFPARPGLAPACYQKGKLAVRVDADADCRKLARCCGGYLLSSSLNRKGGALQQPGRARWLRWHRYLRACMPGTVTEGNPSSLYELTRSGIRKLR